MGASFERIDWLHTIIPRVKDILHSYSYRPTLRQVFYRLVAAQLIPNTEVSYKSLSRVTVMAREQGIIDPLAFEDRVRHYEGGDDGWENPQDFVHAALASLKDSWKGYTRPLWSSQQRQVIIWLEKDALLRPVSEIASRYRVRTYAARGYSSFSAVYEAAQEINGTKPKVVLMLTDFDPSGEDMVRDLEERLSRYGAEGFEVRKIGLTFDQVRSLGLPPMPAKKSDPRYQTFAISYGNEAVELDALPPNELERIIVEAIEDLIDATAWNAEIAREMEERDEVRRLIDELSESPGGGEG